MSQVLFDIPGPRARLRHRVLGVVTVLVVAALLAFIVLRFAESGQFSAQKWQLFTFPLVHQTLIEATLSTLRAFGLAAVLSLAFGAILAVGRLSEHRVVSVPCLLFIELFRAVPLLVLMMILYYGLPPLGVDFITPFFAVVAGLTLYNGAVFAEIFRAGIESLPKGQGEAGYALGLRKTQVMVQILMPQALRAMAPIIVSQLVVVLKDTALGFVITYHELLFTAKFYGSQGNYGFPIIPTTIIVATIYISLCLLLAGVAKLIEVRTRRGRGGSTARATRAAVQSTLVGQSGT